MKPERYEARYEAMMDSTQFEGGYIMEYTEYHDAGELIAKFTLRLSEPRQDD
jgi:hypothetical protein